MTEPFEPRSTHLYLIRHGESTAQAERTIGGMHGDRGLTSLGVTQAESLRDRLAATGEIIADVVIASTMPRARQTAEIIAPAFGVPIVLNDDMQEVRPGIVDGMTEAEAEARFRLSTIQHEPQRPLSPGGESWEQFVSRVGTELDRIARDHAGKRIVIVAHAGVVEVSFLCFFSLSSLAPPPVQFWTHNTSITHWQRSAGVGPDRRWRLRRYNDTMHLLEVGDKPIDWGLLAARPGVGADRPAVPLPTDVAPASNA